MAVHHRSLGQIEHHFVFIKIVIENIAAIAQLKILRGKPVSINELHNFPFLLNCLVHTALCRHSHIPEAPHPVTVCHGIPADIS